MRAIVGPMLQTIALLLLVGMPLPVLAPAERHAMPSLAPVLLARAAEWDFPSVRVLIINTARVRENTLAAARGEAERIFRCAGVQIVWFACGGAGDLSECGLDTGRTLLVQIVPQSANRFVSRTALGYSVAASQNAVYATVFHKRVLQLAGARGVRCSDSVLLGHAIAHELGHLLLGNAAHARYGLMASPWKAADLDRASVGLLHFTPAEGTRIRAEALRRGEHIVGSVSEGGLR